MYPQKTYSLTDIVNKISNWYFNLNLIQQVVVLVGVGLVLREIAPKNYYFKPKLVPNNYFQLKPLPRKEFTDSDKKTTRIYQNYRCDECHQFNANLQYHHKDGHRWNNDISNCQGLCPNCHAKKHQNSILF